MLFAMLKLCTNWQVHMHLNWQTHLLRIHTIIIAYFNKKKICNALAENDEAKQCACETMSQNVDDISDYSSVELSRRKHTLILIRFV